MRRRKIHTYIFFALLSAALNVSATENRSSWPLWNSYYSYFGLPDGRIRDPEANDRTTSEAQAYGMFFAVVANDRERFDGLLRWTENNLAAGDLGRHLPAWSWGLKPDGSWSILDRNPASDADVWIAYSLIQAGHLWNEPGYVDLGRALARRIASEEVVDLPGFGLMLLPGRYGFKHGAVTELNPSYLPLQALQALAQELPDGPWRRIAGNIPKLIEASSRNGFVMDWVTYDPDKGFAPSKGPRDLPMGAWDAVRAYLWAGMLDPAASQKTKILKMIGGMDQYLRLRTAPPMKVNELGNVTDKDGSIGVTAALIPYLLARGSKSSAEVQKARMKSSFDPSTGLYGRPPRYYDQNLALFCDGWLEHRFGFSPTGVLKVSWENEQ